MAVDAAVIALLSFTLVGVGIIRAVDFGLSLVR